MHEPQGFNCLSKNGSYETADSLPDNLWPNRHTVVADCIILPSQKHITQATSRFPGHLGSSEPGFKVTYA